MLLRRLRERFVTHLIGDYVPVLNLVRRPARWPTLAELRSFPEGTLGREVAAYLDARGLPFKVRYENHDAGADVAPREPVPERTGREGTPEAARALQAGAG